MSFWFAILMLIVTAAIGGGAMVARRAPPREPFKHLVPGKEYEVIEPFRDGDGKLHVRGKTWFFVGYAYRPGDATLILSIEPGTELVFQWTPEGQQDVVNNLEAYIAPL